MNCTLTEPIPRLVRFVGRMDLPTLPTTRGESILAMLDGENNLLRINRELYAGLSEEDKDRVLKTRHRYTYIQL